jgi:hypothetical protein
MPEDSPVQSHPVVERERFIEELAGPDDRWLTIGQAVLATGESELTIRQWIGKGLLPVRRPPEESGGQQRLVRASDLALLTRASAARDSEQAEQRPPETTARQRPAVPSKGRAPLRPPAAAEHGAETEELRRLVRDQSLWQQEALEQLRRRLEERLAQQQESFARQCTVFNEALAQLQTSFEDEVAALQIQSGTRQSELEQQVEELTAQLWTATQQWQRTLELQGQRIDALTTHVQQEVKAHEQLAKEVLNLNTQLMEQRLASQQMLHSIGQLSHQLAALTTQLSEQRQRLEQQESTQNQHRRQIEQIEQKIEEREQIQVENYQEVLGVLAGQQEQLAALLTSLNEQAQRYELLSQLYVNLEQQQEEQERRLLRLYHFLEQLSSTYPSAGFTGQAGQSS